MSLDNFNTNFNNSEKFEDEPTSVLQQIADTPFTVTKVKAGVIEKPEEGSILGCTRYKSSANVQLIVIDAGMEEWRKHETFAHEVIHELGHCSELGSDSEHIDPKRWKEVLGKTKDDLYCSGRFDYGDFVRDWLECDTSETDQ